MQILINIIKINYIVNFVKVNIYTELVKCTYAKSHRMAGLLVPIHANFPASGIFYVGVIGEGLRYVNVHTFFQPHSALHTSAVQSK